jgi:hypothetical protein
MNSPYFLESDEIDLRFTYHPPRSGQPEKYEAIRNAANAFARLISSISPPSREQSLAIGKLEEAVMWVNAAIARREGDED